ncbi:hypothetical protein MMC20_002749 [Loxospora ochrophaea]|nr:hypothetical protein [Loxospora ochrophaea]
MPFVPHTPESLVARSDSKNPATTCKGITSSGRPCRRALAASPQASPAPSPNGNRGVLAVLPIGSEELEAAAFFCWQHKDQAEMLVGGESERKTKVIGLKGRSSIDTLADRLGVLEIQGNEQKSKKQKSQPLRRETLPKQWQNVPGPLMAVPEKEISGKHTKSGTESNHHRKPRPESNLALFCCIRSTDREPTQPARVRTHSEPTRDSKQSSCLPASVASPKHPRRPSKSQPIKPTMPTSNSVRPPLPRDPSSQTQDLLALMPKTLSPQTTSSLLAELAKPISSFDQEPGYIYIFWLTDTASATPAPQLASSLLSPPASHPPNRRRTSDLIQDFASTSTSPARKTLLLKIGRASNVQRRMNEWSRQCNHNLSLIRYYPYISPQTSIKPPPSPPPTPRKVPHIHRVERLIHIELSEKRVKRSCQGCGKEHREWFEIEASREGLRGVDETVKRWVGWGERVG